MRKFDGMVAYHQLTSNLRARTARVPSKNDLEHFRNGGLFPPLYPKFQINKGEKIFTIGSCFARNIESVLNSYRFMVPVSEFSIHPGELPYPGPHMLNEYNAGTMMQRIEAAYNLFQYDDMMGIEETAEGFIDLFLHIHAKPTTKERLIERRREINILYDQIQDADVVIITLGLVESWFDKRYSCYLNRAPSKKMVASYPDRFEFHQMDVNDVFERMSRVMSLLLSKSEKRVLMTVSPVPIEATFMPMGAVIANSYSKAVLRTCTGMLSSSDDRIDYFPSYEIVTSFGSGAFIDDNVHVRQDLVIDVTHYMVEKYAKSVKHPTEEEIYNQFITALHDLDGGSAQELALLLYERHPTSWRSHDALRMYFMAIGSYRAALDSAIQASNLVEMGREVFAEHILEARTLLERQIFVAHPIEHAS